MRVTTTATILLLASTVSADWFDGGYDFRQLPDDPWSIDLPLLPTATRFSGGDTYVYFDLQAAVDDAVDGDRIEVGPGTWDGGLVIEDKNNLTIVGDNLLNTIIDGHGVDRGLRILTSSNVSLSQFTVTNCVSTGFGDAALDSHGASVCAGWSPNLTISGCRLANNYATDSGGGLYAQGCTDLTVDECFITGNTAGWTGEAYGAGGGVFLGYCDGFTLRDTMVSENSAISGGGIFVNGDSGTMEGLLFFLNTSPLASALTLWAPDGRESHVTLSQVGFVGNASTSYGGGNIPGCTIDAGQNVSLVVDQSVFWRNRSNDVGGIAAQENADVDFRNCHFIGNRGHRDSDIMRVEETASATITNSNTDCGQSFADGIDGTWATGGGNGTLEHCAYTADLNWDATVNVHDLLILLENWGDREAGITDLVRPNGSADSDLDADDLVLMLSSWGQTAPHPLF